MTAGGAITSATHGTPPADVKTSMGVSAGDGLLHYVLLSRDDLGRSVVDTRVIDVDHTDGLDDAERVNAGIDIMLTAADDAGLHVGSIGVAARTGAQRRALRSRKAGTRRQVRLMSDDEAVTEYLLTTGLVDRFASVVVVDCGDDGMSLFTLEPERERITGVERSRVLTGRALDRAIARVASDTDDTIADALGSRGRRESLLSACRTAKEELSSGEQETTIASVTTPDGVTRVELTAGMVDEALSPMLAKAEQVLGRYVENITARGVTPEAVVFVGGLAHFAAVRSLASAVPGLELVDIPEPELAAAVGAAHLADGKGSAATRLAFIGGRRGWFSPTPVAVVGAVLAAAAMTVYAMSSSLAGWEVQAPGTPSPAAESSETTVVPQVPPIQEPSEDSATVPPVTTTTFPVEPPRAQPQPTGTPDPTWETTELPTASSPSTSTRTLVPYPAPSLPSWPDHLGPPPSIPEDLLPPGLVPPAQSRPDAAPPASGTPSAEAPSDTPQGAPGPGVPGSDPAGTDPAGPDPAVAEAVGAEHSES